MAKRGKNSAADLSATLEKAIRKLTREVDKKLGQLQEAIAAARDILQKHQLQSGGTPPTPPKKSVSKTRRARVTPKGGGTPPTPPKTGTRTATRKRAASK